MERASTCRPPRRGWRMASPIFPGIWTADRTDVKRPGNTGNPNDAVTSRQMNNMGVDMPGGLPYQPWQVPIVKKRTANLAIDDPHIKCMPDNFLRAYGMPHFLKFVSTPGLFLTLNELNAGYRQVFTDARPLPVDPNPTLQGYSSGKWNGDTLVVDSIGFRDDTWIDWNGSVITEAAKVREEFRRPDFGHIVIQVTRRRSERLHQAMERHNKRARCGRRGIDRRDVSGE